MFSQGEVQYSKKNLWFILKLNCVQFNILLKFCLYIKHITKDVAPTKLQRLSSIFNFK